MPFIRPVRRVDRACCFTHPSSLSMRSVFAASAFGVTAAAFGQAAPQPDAAASTAVPSDIQVQTVIVTGSRRREPVRDVPLSVSTADATQLRESGAQQLSDYLETMPGVNVNGGDRGLQQVTIRGVTIGGDINPPTSTYLDDVPFGGSTQFGAKLSLDLSSLDLNHIEVYRGPQGTLYGANALGGVVKYVFNEPDSEEFSTDLTLGASSTRHGGINWQTAAVMNLPVKQDVLGVRVALTRTQDAGHTDSVGPLSQSRVDRDNADGARISALLTPARRLTVRFTFLDQDLHRDGGDYTDYTLAGKLVHGANEHEGVVPEPFRQKTQVASADVEYEFPFARFNTVVSHQSSRNSFTTDDSSFYVPLLLSSFPGLATVSQREQVNTDRDTLELRLTSPRSTSLEWITGVYADKERSRLFEAVDDTMTDGGPGPDLGTATIPTTYREIAVFGDLTFFPLPDLAITGGARVARNNQGFDQTVTPPSAQFSPAHSSDTSRTYLGTVRYTLTPKSNVYLRVASGYNPGGNNAALLDPGSGTTASVQPTYKPNTLVSSELGYKADLLDGKLSLETALYHLDWRSIQIEHTLGASGEVINGGKAAVDGIEFGATIRPDASWTFTPAFAYTDARLRQDVPDLQAVSGNTLPATARLTASVGGRYAFALDGAPAYAGLTYRYIGRRSTDFVDSTNPPNYVMPSYSLFNGQLGVQLKSFDLSFFVRNIADVRGQRSAASGYVAYGGPVQVSLEEPRTIGLTVRTSF